MRDLVPAAGNGLYDRRAFLRGGAALAAAMTGYAVKAETLSEPAWGREPGMLVPPYGVPSPFEKTAVRTLSNPKGEPRTQHARTPHHLLQGMVTPAALHFTISHAGNPDVVGYPATRGARAVRRRAQGAAVRAAGVGQFAAH